MGTPYFDWAWWRGETRRAIQLTWTSDTRIKHISVYLKRNPDYPPHTTEISSIEWEFREGTSGDETGLANSTVKASGSWVWDNDDLWPPHQERWATAVFTSPVTINSSKYYWFVIKIPGDVVDIKFKPAWLIQYNSSGAPTGYAQVYSYCGGSWSKLADWYCRYEITDPQAGVKYHCVVDGVGFMTPDDLASYRCQLATSFGANLRGGMQKYSQLQYPYSSFSQDSFYHGMGWLRFEDPQTYWFGMNVDMRVDGQAILAPLPTITTVNDDWDRYLPDNRYDIELPWRKHSSDTVTVQKVAQPFTLKANDTLYGVVVYVKKHWQNAKIGGDLKVSLCQDNSGNPGSVIETKTITSHVRQWTTPVWVDFSNYTAGTSDENLWIVVETTATDFSSFEVWAGCPPGDTGEIKYYDGSTWKSDNGYSLVFCVNHQTFVQDWNDLDHPAFFCEFNGDLYFAYHQKVYKWSETSNAWSVVDTVSGGECKGLAAFGDYIYAAWGSGNVVRRSNDGSTWNDVSGINADLLWVGKGYLWKKDTTNGHKIQYSNDGTTWSSDISVGTDDYEVTGFCEFNNVVVVAKEDGLYYIDRDFLAHSYFLYRDQADSLNGKNIQVWSNNIYIPVHSGLWRWTGSMVDMMGPDRRSGMPKYWRGRVADMLAFGNGMFVAYDNNASASDWSSLLYYNGIGWHGFLMGQTQSTDGRLTALALTTDIGNETRLWIFTNYHISYIVLSDRTENHFEWDGAKFITEGWFVTPWWDGGLYNAKKYFNNVTFVADGLTDNTYIDIFYQLDGADIDDDQYYLGRLDSSSPNPQTFHLPDETEAYSIRFIFYLYTQDASETPRLRSYNCECLVRPPASYVHSVALTIGDRVRLMDGSEDTNSADTLWTHLQKAQAKVTPIIVHFPFKSVRGFISALQEQTSVYKEQGATPQWERVALLSIVEA